MDRALVLRKRQKRRRRLIAVGFLMVLGVLVTAGVALGAAVGVAAERVRGSELFERLMPDVETSLPANKITPPAPVDVSGPAGPCAASSLVITVTPERASLEFGEATGIHVVATNVGSFPCLVNGGMENLRLRIVDASGVAGFNWEHCGAEGSRKLLVGPGMQVNWDVAWDGNTSAAGHCTSEQPPLPRGEWKMVAALSEVAHSDSEPAALTIAPLPEPEPTPNLVDDELNVSLEDAALG